VARIDKRKGRRLFGSDPAGYDRARPGHADRVYEVLVERCGLGPGTAVLEVGPGTGQATRRLLELGADPLVAIEPDPALAEYLSSVTGGRPDIRIAALEEVELPSASFDLAVAASSFHWVNEDAGLAMLLHALRPGGRAALWWTLFGEGDATDAFITATSGLLDNLSASPTRGVAGRPAHALDTEARLESLRAAGFDDAEHELARWRSSWDVPGIRALYGTFSPIASLDDEPRLELLDEIERIARDDFGGRVSRTLTTSLYTARKPC